MTVHVCTRTRFVQNPRLQVCASKKCRCSKRLTTNLILHLKDLQKQQSSSEREESKLGRKIGIAILKSAAADSSNRLDPGVVTIPRVREFLECSKSSSAQTQPFDGCAYYRVVLCDDTVRFAE